MNVTDILNQFESLGDAARKKHNTKAGAPENQFGVKHGDIRAMAKKLKTNHELALELWKTGNVEAQLLATLIIQPASLSMAEVESMTKTIAFAHVAEWWNSYVVALHPAKEKLRQKWMKSKDPWCARGGWHLTASRINQGADDLDLPALLSRIEKELAKALPVVQWTMNNTLAAIGIKHAALRTRVMALGERSAFIGTGPCRKAARRRTCRSGSTSWSSGMDQNETLAARM
jgi:3-methyladenine DNA glycosylase AlkD